jgi:hypothetical protein
VPEKLEVKFKRGGRIRESHGGYSFIVRGCLPEHRKYLLSYLIAARENIIVENGGEQKMSASQIVILDRAIGKLGICRLMEEFARENGIMSSGELIPCLKKNYLAFSNSLRRDLESIKDLGADQTDQTPTIQELIQEFDSQKESEVAKKSTNFSGDGRG